MTNYKLESVGTVITSRGWTYPMLTSGGFDIENGVHLSDIEPDGDWFNGLTTVDKALVEFINETWAFVNRYSVMQRDGETR